MLLERSGVRPKTFRDFAEVTMYLAFRRYVMVCRPQEEVLSLALVGGFAVEAPLEACEGAKKWMLNVSDVEDWSANKVECTKDQHAVTLEHVKKGCERRGDSVMRGERLRAAATTESKAQQIASGRVLTLRRWPECRPLCTVP